jgi:hypothetical protein
MEAPNAFIGRTTLPTPEEVSASLGSSAESWNQLIDWFVGHNVSTQVWQSISPKYGWGLRLKLKKRTIVYLGPCDGCFHVSFVLGDRAVAAALKADLSASTLKLLDEAPRYAEGTGLRLMVKVPKDLAAIHKLALIKLAN